MKLLFLWLWIGWNVGIGQIADFNAVDFLKADSVAAHYAEADLSNLPVLAYHLTKDLSSEVEQFRAIYTWVCLNIDGDPQYFSLNDRKRKKYQGDKEALVGWNNTFCPKVMNRLFTEQTTVCTGYAYLIQALASFAGFNCKIIHGYGRSANTLPNEIDQANHSWNAIQINGAWYLCDATWSSGYIYGDEFGDRFIQEYFDGYFLAHPAIFAKNHYPLDTFWLLQNNKQSLEEFKKAPLIRKDALIYGVVPILPERKYIKLARNDQYSFVFEKTQDIEESELSIELVNGKFKQTIFPEVTYNKEGQLILTHQFNQLGYYEVTVKMKGQQLVSYTIWVKRDKRMNEV